MQNKTIEFDLLALARKYWFQISIIARHPENALSDYQDATFGFFTDLFGPHQLLFKTFHIIMMIDKPFTHMQPDPYIIAGGTMRTTDTLLAREALKAREEGPCPGARTHANASSRSLSSCSPNTATRA